MMKKSIAILGCALSRFTKSNQKHLSRTGRSIIIPVIENLAHDQHKDLVKAAALTWLSAWLLITPL